MLLHYIIMGNVLLFLREKAKKNRSTHVTGRSPKVCPHLIISAEGSWLSWYKHTLVLLMLVCSFSFLSLFFRVYSCIFFLTFSFSVLHFNYMYTFSLIYFYLNRPFARWRHFTTTTRILFVFRFIFKFGNPSEVWITKALISTRKQNPEGFWS